MQSNLIKVYITPFIDNSKWTKKSLKVKIFLHLLGTYKEVCQIADIYHYKRSEIIYRRLHQRNYLLSNYDTKD